MVIPTNFEQKDRGLSYLLSNKVFLVLLSFNFLVKERKCPATNLQTLLHQLLDYKLLFIPKATKCLVSAYPINYKKPPVTPTS